MSKFFDYYLEIPREDAFELFDVYHIVGMMTMLIVIFASLYFLKALECKKIELIIKVTAIILPLLEVSRIVWLYETGSTTIVNLMPLHLCGLQLFFIPMLVYTDIPSVKDFTYCTAILGGIAGGGFLSGIAGTYPFFHFQTIQSLLYHAILIFIPLAMIIYTGYVPNVKNFPKVLIIFLVVCILVGIFDYAYDQNYMFLQYPPSGTPLVLIYDKFGLFSYLMTTLALAVVASLIMFVPFSKKSKRKIK